VFLATPTPFGLSLSGPVPGDAAGGVEGPSHGLFSRREGMGFDRLSPNGVVYSADGAL
jgi:hypothetical protein